MSAMLNFETGINTLHYYVSMRFYSKKLQQNMSTIQQHMNWLDCNHRQWHIHVCSEIKIEECSDS